MFMKLRILIRTTVVCSLVSLCLMLGFYSYYKLQASENQHDFNLYALVPHTATAVLETQRLAELLEDVDQLQCSKEGRFLKVSELFSFLKQNYRSLLSDTPHGLSKQMNQMLLSFHQPDTPSSQVLYCSLGRDDQSLIRRMVEKYSQGGYPPKTTRYRSEKLHIYPLSDGRFLSLYITDRYMALSFQKHLLEQVIDAEKEGSSLLKRSNYFRTLHDRRQVRSGATLFVRMKRVSMGSTEDTLQTSVQLGTWVEFELKLAERAIYGAGISKLAEADSIRSFAKMLKAQQPIEGFVGNTLPSSTFCYDHWALSNRTAYFGFTLPQTYAQMDPSDELKAQDAQWISLLDSVMAGQATTCLFTAGDTLGRHTCMVLACPLREPDTTEPILKQHLASLSSEVPLSGETFPRSGRFSAFTLPPTTLFRQLTGMVDSTLTVCATLHRHTLLLAPDTYSLSAYIDALERGDILESHPLYQEAMSSLAPTYNFLMMADMGQLLCQPKEYMRMIPRFFYRHADFFRHFILAVQYTFTDDMAYPNVVLLHR